MSHEVYQKNSQMKTPPTKLPLITPPPYHPPSKHWIQAKSLLCAFPRSKKRSKLHVRIHFIQIVLLVGLWY